MWILLLLILWIAIGRGVNYAVKPGADIRGLHPAMWTVLPAIEEIFVQASDGVPMVITSGVDSLDEHGQGHRGRTLHDDGLAVDLRTRNLVPGRAEVIVDDLNRYLGNQGVQAIFEVDHIHVEREGII